MAWSVDLRREEYTGANRCLPCTVLNVCLVGLGGLLVALWTPPLGIAFVLAGLAVVYFRGYLVPYTPRLTRRYLPERVLRWFGKPAPPETELADTPAFLDDLDLLEPCPDRDDVCLVPGFEREWREAVDSLRDRPDRQREHLSRMLDLPPPEMTIDEGSSVTALVEGTTVGEWYSRAALLADLAAASVLESTRGDRWRAHETPEQGAALAILRAFVETCPACAGTVGFETEEGEACCWTREVTTVRCRDCGALLLELDELSYDDGETAYL